MAKNLLYEIRKQWDNHFLDDDFELEPGDLEEPTDADYDDYQDPYYGDSDLQDRPN